MEENIDKDKISENPLNENENSNIIENINELIPAQEFRASSQVEEDKPDEMMIIEDPEPTNDEKAAKSDDNEQKTDAVENSTKHENAADTINEEIIPEVKDLIENSEDLVQKVEELEQTEMELETNIVDMIQPETTVFEKQPENSTSIQKSEEPIVEQESTINQQDTPNKEELSKVTANLVIEPTNITFDNKEYFKISDDDTTTVEESTESNKLTKESQLDKIDVPSTSEGILLIYLFIS